MKRMGWAALGLTVGLAGCGTVAGDRTLSGAMVGAGAGAVVGPVGSAVGAVAGAGVGYVTHSDDLYLGKPFWKRSDGRRHTATRRR